MPTPEASKLLRTIRLWIILFIVGLALSGITAFPLVHELNILAAISAHLNLAQHIPALNAWILHVKSALIDTSTRYPFLAYGTDWLAFGHLVIATAFLGAYRDPIRNRWLIDWGLIACLGVFPLAFIAGPIRGIPLYWRLIDSSFGFFGAIPLLIVRRKMDQLEALATI